MALPEGSDALVFFGATGDLAYKKLFPALQALARDGLLEGPVIGVARGDWTLDKLRERARDSVEHNGGIDAGAFAKLSDRLRYVDGDYADPSTFHHMPTKSGAGTALKSCVCASPLLKEILRP